MSKRVIMLAAAVILLAVFGLIVYGFINGNAAQNAQTPAKPAGGLPAGDTDPQHLLIPRWFLTGITLEGREVAVPEGQQQQTLQFEPGTRANGGGGCNNFGATYQASGDGKITFGPIMATKMACDIIDRETAYLDALSKVQQFAIVDGKLVLSSTDGQTRVIFARPPK